MSAEGQQQGDGSLASQLVPGRSCNGCTMCCKLPRIPEIEKPRAVLCTNCTVGVGCKIYDRRPDACREFFCGYMLNATLGEEWRPSSCKMLVTYEAEAERVVIHVDSTRRDAWRKEPFLSHIKTWAKQAPRGHVLIWQGSNVIVVFADREVDMGRVREDQYILIREKRSPAGKTYEAHLVEPDDPRLKAKS